MHRIHLTTADLARVRLMPTLGPMAETLFSLRALRGRSDEAMFGHWRHGVRASLGQRFGILAAIAPVRLPCLDLTTLGGPGRELADSGEGLLASTRQAVTLELDFYASRHGHVPAVLRPLADDLTARRELLDTLGAYHRLAIGSRWSRIRSHLDADRAQRGTVMLDTGVDGLLTTLHPSVRWQDSVLHIHNACKPDVEFHLDGRGLLLVPSFFLRSPVVMYDPEVPENCTLVFPAQLDIDHVADVWANTEPGRALANLLGRTRALVLTAIADGVATTGALASLAGTSSAAASQHTAILREAGLIITRRYRNTVRHSLTQTGLSLLAR